jgi:murein L,D-transpeptidase YafK
MKLVILFFTIVMPFQDSFKDKQLQFPRVKAAYSEKEITVKKYFNNKNLIYQGFHLYIRAFKAEQILEVWVKDKQRSTYELLVVYPFCSTSGVLGPKRKEGDRQIPEGVYAINHFNPNSNFHLSLGLNYPNQSDRILSDKRSPGSAIYIHGNCVTIGCIPITDDKIKELYILAVEGKNNGQGSIPVHIFPAKLTHANFAQLKHDYMEYPDLIGFWKSLQDVYSTFELTKEIPLVKTRMDGAYTCRQKNKTPVSRSLTNL